MVDVAAPAVAAQAGSWGNVAGRGCWHTAHGRRQAAVKRGLEIGTEIARRSIGKEAGSASFAGGSWADILRLTALGAAAEIQV